jgi:4-hydroxy-tetrahydrodipicolinate synthase
MTTPKTYTQSKFRGQIYAPAPVTPASARGELMLDAFAEILEYYVGIGADTLLIAGDNGEGYALDGEELRRVTETAVRVIRGRIPFFVHVSRVTTRESIARAHIAADAGAPGISLMPQSYIHAATTAEVVARYAAVSKAVPLPMMMFTSFRQTQIRVKPEMLRAVCDVSPICALKDDSSFDTRHVLSFMREFNDRFPLLFGGVPNLLIGSGGFIGTGPELLGRRVRDFLKVNEMTLDERLRMHEMYMDLVDAVLYEPVPPSGIIAGLNLIGLPAGVPRDPVQPLGPEGVARIRAVLTRYGVLS